MKSVSQSCVEDEGRPLEIGFQEQVSNQPECCSKEPWW